MKHHFYIFFIFFHGLSTAIPLDIVRKTRSTTAPDGSIIDWVPIQSQVANGNIASAPPLPFTINSINSDTNTSTPQPIPHSGPPGTVPILRSSGLSVKKQPPPNIQNNGKIPRNSGFSKRKQSLHNNNLRADSKTKRAAGDHWYASSSQTVNNHGGSASYSLYKAWTESGADFSLLQSAVVRTNVPKPGDNTVLVSQTVEAGWINYPNQVAEPHLFVYFTTDGYSSNDDYKGGWNRDVLGWVQTDTSIYPGISFAPLATRGSSQYDIKIQWYLHQGNWWLFVIDRWIGYYPASMFGASTVASSSLQQQASQILYYGEIFDSHAQLTKTDMGSGSWPEAGYGQSAYIRNMVYTDTGDVDRTYDGSSSLIVSDTNRYRLSASWNSGSSWGSYFYLGGPGAGGIIDG